jgi:hypothetical protein
VRRDPARTVPEQVLPVLEAHAVVVITGRNDFDDRLFGTFSRCMDPPPRRLRPLAFCIEQDRSLSGLRNLTFGRSQI